MDKQILIDILNKCTKNKSFNDFNLLLTAINYLKDDKTVYKSKDISKDSISILLVNENWAITIRFYKDNNIGLVLPYSGLFIIPNCGYNIQYADIKKRL